MPVTEEHPTTIEGFIKSLPPLEEIVDGEEYVEGGQEQSLEPEVATGFTETTGEETADKPARARDAQGKFTKDGETAETVETATETPAEAAQPTPEDIQAQYVSSLSEEQRNAYEFAKALQSAEDPVALLVSQFQQAGLTDQLLTKMGLPEDVVASLKAPAAQVDIDPDYEPSDVERLLMPNLAHLAKFPESVKEISEPVARQVVGQEIQRLVPHLDAYSVETVIAAQKLGAIAEALGMNLPEVDRGAVMKALQDPNMDYVKAVNSVIGDRYKTAIADFKQAMAPRPETPGSETSGSTEPTLHTDANGFKSSRMIDDFARLFGKR